MDGYLQLDELGLVWCVKVSAHLSVPEEEKTKKKIQCF